MKRLMVMLLAAGAFAVGSLSPTAALRSVRKSEAGEAAKADAGAGSRLRRRSLTLQRLRRRSRKRQRHPRRPLPAEAPKPPNINKGDTAFMYAATMMVILMTIPGLALFYGGLVRSKNMLSVLMQVFVTFALISILWMIYGYSVAFTGGGPFFGGLSKMFLSGVRPNLPRRRLARTPTFRS